MASALVDRLLHHGHVITFKGESYRMRHALMNSAKAGDNNA
jgi:DNA replication protein DnaC